MIKYLEDLQEETKTGSVIAFCDDDLPEEELKSAIISRYPGAIFWRQLPKRETFFDYDAAVKVTRTKARFSWDGKRDNEEYFIDDSGCHSI